HPAPPLTYTLSLHDALPIYLLRQDVQRGLGHDDPVELLIADRARHRSRLAELLAPGDDDPPLRHAGEEVARAAHALKGRGDVARSEEHTSELQSRGHLVCRL